MSETHLTNIAYSSFSLPESLMQGIEDSGFYMCTPIQAEIMPSALAGKDAAGRAQTGTGKTAAFALPLLSRINLKIKNPQVLVLTPTRELAIQVAEAFKGYASHLKNFHILKFRQD